MKTSYKYIKFEMDEPEDHKRWFCRNKKTELELFQVIFYEPWNQWVTTKFTHKPDIVINQSCHDDISHFLGQLNTKSPTRKGNN